MRHLWLRTILIARFAVSVGFVAWVSETVPTFAELRVPVGWFAAVDGVLSLAMAAFALGIPLLRRGVAMVAALDGVWLVAAAATLLGGRGVPDFGLTILLYLGLAAICALVLGLLRIHAAEEVGDANRTNTLNVGLYIAGIASAAFGVGAIFVHPSPELLRLLLMTAATIEGLALLAVAFRRWPSVESVWRQADHQRIAP